MVGRRARNLLILTVCLATLLSASAGATVAPSSLSGQVAADADGCAGGVDAGNSFASATLLDVPFSRCVGRLTSSDPEDWYSFHLEAGDRVQFVLERAAQSEQVPMGCFFRPTSGNTAYCLTSGQRFDLKEFVADATGEWRLRLGDYKTNGPGPHAYRITLTRQLQTETGTALAGTMLSEAAPGGLAHHHDQLNGTDGVWLPLATVADGNQSALLLFAGKHVAGADMDARFYDSDGVALPSQPCAMREGDQDEWCTVPAGAAAVLVEAYYGLELQFEFHYFW